MAPVYKFSNAGFLGRTYKSVLAENSVFVLVPPGSFQLLETYTLSSSQDSIELTNVSSYSTNYGHLQIRLSARTDYPRGYEFLNLQFNNDSTNSNYVSNQVITDGGNTNSYSYGDQLILGMTPASLAPSGEFGMTTIDILDPFHTNKFTSLRFTQSSTQYPWAGFGAGIWRNSQAIDTIKVFGSDAGNIVANSTVALYGMKVS